MNPTVTAYLHQAKTWQEEMKLLRSILLDCGMQEDLKWGKPCYSYQNTNLIIIQPFKSYCALGFFKGSVLGDPQKILIKPGENTQGGRQIRFTGVKEIADMEPVLKQYVFEAIEAEKAGVKVQYKKTKDYDVPEELEVEMNRNPNLKSAFEALTPGRQRGYLLYFGGAKQSKTRVDRVKRYMPRILAGKGMEDCICGLSKRYPACDGSHKQLEKKGR